MKKVISILAVALVLAWAGSAMAVTISATFDNDAGSTTMVAGYVPVGNWNIAVGSLSATNVAVVDETGAATSVLLSYGWEQSQNPTNTPSGGTAGNLILYGGAGARQYDDSSPSDSWVGNGQILFTNLNALMPNGYIAYVYYTDISYDWIGGSNGTIYASDAADFTTSANTPTSLTNIAAQGNYVVPNGAAWNGTFTEGTNYTPLGSIATPLTADGVTITMHLLARNGAAWTGFAVVGVQIVGLSAPEPPPIPEPAGLGLLGVALLALKKRRRC